MQFNSFLPCWNSELQVEIPDWFPWGKDYQPVSLNRFHDEILRDIAASCFDLDSEFYFMASPLIGIAGGLSREKYFQDRPENTLHLGFLMVFAYSEKLEKAILVSLNYFGIKKAAELGLGITNCSIWRNGVFEGKTKIIAIASDEPFYDGDEYLSCLASTLREVKNVYRTAGLSFFAEKLGYERFLLEWENVNFYDARVTEILSEIEDENVKEIVGGSPLIEFPPFFGLSLTKTKGD